MDRLTDQSSIATLQALQSTEHPRGIFVIDGDWTLEGLRAHLADETAIAREGGVYTVGLPIVVMGEATLSILGPEVSELRLLADYGALLSNHGSLFVVDTRLLGWSEGDGAPAFFVDKTVFRPFVLGSTVLEPFGRLRTLASWIRQRQELRCELYQHRRGAHAQHPRGGRALHMGV